MTRSFFTDTVDETGKYYADVYLRDVWEDIKPPYQYVKGADGLPHAKASVAVASYYYRPHQMRAILCLIRFVGVRPLVWRLSNVKDDGLALILKKTQLIC